MSIIRKTKKNKNYIEFINNKKKEETKQMSNLITECKTNIKVQIEINKIQDIHNININYSNNNKNNIEIKEENKNKKNKIKNKKNDKNKENIQEKNSKNSDINHIINNHKNINIDINGSSKEYLEIKEKEVVIKKKKCHIQKK